MWNPHNNTCVRVRVPASLQLCKVGSCAWPWRAAADAMSSPPFLFFRKRCVGAYAPPAAHCYLSSKRKQLQFLLDVFLCLFSFCSFQWNQRRKKQVSTCGYMRVHLRVCICVCFVWLDGCLCGSRQCVVVREPEVKRTQAVSYSLSNLYLELLIFGFTLCCVSTMGKMFIRIGKGSPVVF